MAEEKKSKTSPAEFVNQVRSETSKVVSLFFLGVDTVFNAVVQWLLSLA